MLCLSISRPSRLSPKRQALTLLLSVLLTLALYEGHELWLSPPVIQVVIIAKSYLTKRRLGWERRKEITLTIQEKCLERNEVAGGINLFGFCASWLIFLFGDKLRERNVFIFISGFLISASVQPHYSHLPFPGNSYYMSILHGSALELLLLGWKKCQLKNWAESSGNTDACQMLSNRWVTYWVTHMISESKGSWLEASFYPSDWEWKLLPMTP